MTKSLPGTLLALVIGLAGWLLPLSLVRAQTPKSTDFTVRTCQCAEIVPSPPPAPGKEFISEHDVALIIDEILGKLPLTEPERARLRGELRVVASVCTRNARALPCPGSPKSGKSKTAGTIRYVLYNTAFMDRIAGSRSENRPISASDYFVLAHELGHHYFNHTHPDEEGKPVLTSARNDKDQLIPYLAREKPEHVNELEADAAAVAVMYRMSRPKKDVLDLFRQMILNRIDLTASDEHPSSLVRYKFAERLWEHLARSKGQFSHQQAHDFADEFYDEETQKQFEIMRERAFWTVLPGVEGLVGQPVFRLASQSPVPALVQPGGGVLVQISRKNWQSPWGYDLALGVSSLSFNTYSDLSGSRRSLEKFAAYWATLQPTYSFHSIGRRDSVFRNQMGWFVSLGGTLRLPFGSTYTNYATGEENTVSTRPKVAVHPTLRLGIERWTTHLPFERRRGTFQVYLSYSPVWLHFPARPDVKALIHQAGLGIVYGF